MTSTVARRSSDAGPGAFRRRRTRALVVLGAAAAAAAGWVLAQPVAGIDLQVVTGDRTQSVGLGPVLGTSLAAGALGWALLAVLEGRTRRAAAVWTAIALGVTVLSLAGPLASATTTSSGVVLAALHVLVAAVLVPGMRRTAATEQS